MLSLKADNRVILRDTKFSFLSSNTLSAVSSLTMISTSGFSADDYLLLGELNSETSEIVQINAVSDSTTVTLKSATVFAHPESTKISRIMYNQVKFYRTTTATFSAGTPLPATNPVNIDPQSFFTKYEDSTNSTGFGWFVFLNSTTSINSSPSNAIPYAGFAENSAYKIIQSFLSSLNNKEMKLLAFDDVFRWLSEAYSIAYNELNLANQEFTTPTVQAITIYSGTQEYALDDDFAKLVSVSDGSGADINYIRQKDIQEYKNINATSSILNRRYYERGSTPRYYFRGSYIGFVPVPTANTTYYIYYNEKSGKLSSYYDNVILPNNEFYILHDYMLYKAGPKIGLSRAETLSYKQDFYEKIKNMKISANKQSANADSFEIDPHCTI